MFSGAGFSPAPFFLATIQNLKAPLTRFTSPPEVDALKRTKRAGGVVPLESVGCESAKISFQPA